MRKVILVSGTFNTGKTSSIRRFLENRGIFHDKRGDITAVIPIKKGKRTVALGVGSGGDNLQVVTRNTLFFDEHGWDVVVCASKSDGATRKHIMDFAKSGRATLIEIRTSWVQTPRVKVANESIAAQIEQALA